MPIKNKRIHFIYAVPHISIYKYLKLKNIPLYRKYWKYLLKWPRPISAPFSITYNIVNALAKDYQVLLYDVTEKGAIELKAEDLVIGHVWPDNQSKEQGSNKWTNYDDEQVINKTIIKYPMDKRVYVITPFNHSAEQLGWATPLLEKTKNYIGICGDYWVENIEKSSFNFLKGRIEHLNMGINSRNYPKVKHCFNEKGKRKFLYIGRISKEKNISMLESIAMSIPGFEGGYIGDGIIKGWKQIAARAALTPKFVKTLASEYDFFINTSTYDAQATTILEAMSWGFVVACTPETGYTEEGIFSLSKDNVEENIYIIDKLNNMNEGALNKIVSGYQVLLREKFTWENFTNKLIDIIRKKS